tara:strand:- start:158 stop:433 length:276 start_codon:yes stop_codon:yes gene_type:complete
MTLPYLDELKSTHLNRCETYRLMLMRISGLDIWVKENWLRSMGWSNHVYLKPRERYNLETVQNMKKMCKQNGIKGYSKLPSRELAKRLMSI